MRRLSILAPNLGTYSIVGFPRSSFRNKTTRRGRELPGETLGLQNKRKSFKGSQDQALVYALCGKATHCTSKGSTRFEAVTLF